MPAPYRGKRPRILWGAAYANTLELGYPLDEAMAYSQLRAGSEFTQARSGIEDGWVTGHDYYLAGAVRWIPRVTGTTPEGNPATGWDGATGWDAMLRWARGKNVLRLELEAGDVASRRDFYLVEPMDQAPRLERDYSRALFLVLRAADFLPVEGF